MRRDDVAVLEPRERVATTSASGSRWREAALVLGCAALIVAATAVPYLLAYWSAPAGTQYVGLLSNPLDGNSYLAKMRQGAAGEWLFHLPYTAEPHEGAFLFPFYLALGHLAAAVQAPLVVVYHAARLIGGMVLLAVAYLFLSLMVGRVRLRRLAWLLFAVGSGLGWLTAPLGYYSADLLIPESTSFHAIFANPHFPFATALLIGVFLLLLKGSGARQPAWGVGAGLAALLLALIQPFLVLIVYVVCAGWLLLLFRAERRVTRVEAILVGLVVLLSWPAVALDYAALYGNPVLAEWTAQNQTPSPSPLSYLLGYGVLSPLAALALRNREARRMLWTGGAELIVSWVVVTVLLLYAPFALQRRFAEGLQMPLVVLATVGVSAVLLPRVRTARGRRRLGLALIVAALPTNLFLLGVSALGVIQSPSAFYLQADEMESFRWLAQRTSSAEVVLASPEAGNLIPAWAGNRVYYGHPFETIRAEAKLDRLHALFGNRMSPPERESFMREAGIRYVYHGERERQLGPFDPEGERYLLRAFSSGSVRIYRVTP